MATKTRQSRAMTPVRAKHGRSHGGRLSSKSDLRGLRQELKMARPVFSRLTGYAERTVADWEMGKGLNAAKRQKEREIRRLTQALAGVMQADYVGEWLQTPSDGFGGAKPLELIERGEVDRIWRMIYQLESGSPS